MDLKWYRVSKYNNAREEKKSYLPRKENKSNERAKFIKGEFYNEGKSDRYNDINEYIVDVERVRGSILSNEEILGLENVDVADEG